MEQGKDNAHSDQNIPEGKIISGKSSLKQSKFNKIMAVVIIFLVAGIGGYLVKRSFAQSATTNPYACPAVNGNYPAVKVGSKDGDTGISGEKCVSAVQWDMSLSQSIHHFDKNNQYPVTVTGTYTNANKNNAKLMQKYFNWYGTNFTGEWRSYDLAVFNAFVPYKTLQNTSDNNVSTSYDQAVLADKPTGYWTLAEGGGSALDRTANKVNGNYKGSATKTTLPNGDGATDFPGKNGTYVEIPDKDQYSISTTKYLTWEAWIRPDTLTSGYDNNYSDFLGKCTKYAGSCEWEGRMYDTKTPAEGENRCNRVSAYVFNQDAKLGSAGDWQPKCGLAQAGEWLHVVGQYQTASTPSDCPKSSYPGTIDIWVNGVKWNPAYHRNTGCMSQFNVAPGNYSSPVTVGTMSVDEYFFKGAVGKFAIYDHALTQEQINTHYKVMTGKDPSGSCANNCTLVY